MAKPVDLDLQTFMRESVVAGLSTRLRLAGEDLAPSWIRRMHGGPLMSADEKRKLAALRAEIGRLAAEIAIKRAGDVLCAEITRLEAEIAAERAQCGPGSELAKEMLEDPEFRAEWKRVATALAASLRQRLEGES